MTADNDDRLLLAVEELTKPQRSKVIQDGSVHTVTLPPLLERMEAAVHSSMGGTSSGASLAHEGSPLDVDALFKMMKILSQIGDWCRIVKVQPVKNATTDLVAWFAAVPHESRTHEYDKFYIRTLGAWANEIETKLDPWRERELPDSCPVCGADKWFNKSDGLSYHHPLVVKYKPDSDDMVNEAKAMCRFCTEVWSVRELAREIELRDEAQTA
jgi:hypothetical protein